MDIYSQNNEQEIVANYFKGRECLTLLDIGANDGITFSNSRGLILDGWEGVLLEPSPKAFERLKILYPNNYNKVRIYNIGIADSDGQKEFWESGSHIGDDVSLLSCINPKEKERWDDTMSFEKISASFITFKTFLRYGLDTKFNFISIDAEGCDWEILQQIDLNKVGCECLCIEHNGSSELKALYENYCHKFHMIIISETGENVIYAKLKETINTKRMGDFCSKLSSAIGSPFTFTWVLPNNHIVDYEKDITYFSLRVGDGDSLGVKPICFGHIDSDILKFNFLNFMVLEEEEKFCTDKYVIRTFEDIENYNEQIRKEITNYLNNNEYQRIS